MRCGCAAEHDPKRTCGVLFKKEYWEENNYNSGNIHFRDVFTDVTLNQPIGGIVVNLAKATLEEYS